MSTADDLLSGIKIAPYDRDEEVRPVTKQLTSVVPGPWYNNLPLNGKNGVEFSINGNIFIARTMVLGKPNAQNISFDFSIDSKVNTKGVVTRIREIISQYGGKEICDYSPDASIVGSPNPNDVDFYSTFYLDDVVIQLSVNSDPSGGRASCGGSFTSQNPDFTKELLLYFESIKSTSTTKLGQVFMLTSTPNGPKFTPVGLMDEPLRRENYTPEVLVAYDRIKDEISCQKPKGRLTIIDGTPGGGKSFLIKGLLAEVERVGFVIVPPHFVPSLSEPTAISAILKLKDQLDCPICLIIEDGDEVIVAREHGNMSAISSLLNSSDGIVGSLLDLRVLVTTNASLLELDKAITRPGRLSTALSIHPHTAKFANQVFKSLTGFDGEFKQPATLAEIYSQARDTGWKPPEIAKSNRPLGFAVSLNDFDD